jgi:membrane protease YdiL (CAAX protease family)
VSTNYPSIPDSLPAPNVPEQFEPPAPTTDALTAKPDPDNPPWGLLQAFLVWLISFALVLLVPLAVGIPYVVYKIVVQGGSPQGLETDPTLIFISILATLPAHLLTIFAVWAFVTRLGKRPFWQAFGWHWPRNFGPFRAIGLAVLLLGFGGLMTWLYGGSETQLDMIVNSSLKARFVTAFLAAVTGPFVEELVYRGVVYSGVRKVLGMNWAIAIVSILFAGVHVLQYFKNLSVIAVIVLLSVSLTLVRAHSRSLMPSYIMHLIFNGIQALILVVQPFVGKSTPEAAPAIAPLIHSLARFLT